MKRVLQRGTQVLFLTLFIILIVTGRIQLWMGILLTGILLALVFGRLYCGWVCPINTVTGSIMWLKQKLSIGSFAAPAFLKREWIRYLTLTLFIALFAFSMITGQKLPVLPALLIAGAVTTLFFPEELWHRYLCPYGAVFSLVSKKPSHTLHIDKSVCSACGQCRKVCKASAISVNGTQYSIQSHECLICRKCVTQCRRNAIGYHKKFKEME